MVDGHGQFNLAKDLSTGDRLETLRHLHRLHFDRFDARRQWEWRGAFTIWAGLGAAAISLRGAQLKLWFVVPLGVAVVIVHWAVVGKWIHPEAEANRQLGYDINVAINEMIDLPTKPLPPYKPIAHYWQVAFTVFLCVVLVAVNWTGSPPPVEDEGEPVPPPSSMGQGIGHPWGANDVLEPSAV